MTRSCAVEGIARRPIPRGAPVARVAPACPLVLLAMLIASVAVAAEPPAIPIGADAYRMWDRWPYQHVGERAYLRSTYDRSGGNDWADASHFLYQLADDYNVVLDVAGPGILSFVRTNHWHGSPWHYEVDGVDHLVRESSTADPIHPVPDSTFLPENLFPRPVALTWSQTRGADLSWVPIAFAKSLRIAYSRTFYGTGYFIYQQFVDGTRLSRPLMAWDGRTPPDPAIAALIDRAGTDLAPSAGSAHVREARGRLELAAHGTVRVWNAAPGPSMLRALEFSVPLAQASVLSSARLQVYWDERTRPSIDAPLALFFGAGILYNREQREYLVKSLPMVIRYGTDRVYLSCYFPMPFFRSVRIDLRGDGQTSIHALQWSVRYTPFTDPPNTVGYFHATYRDHPHPTPGQDLVLLDTHAIEDHGTWSGQLVGTSFIFSHAAGLKTLEGDPRFFFDDSQTPQAQGTGTEEWGGGGDYWGGQNMTLAFVGHPVGARSPDSAVSAEDRIESAYRFLLADLMPFGSSAVIRLEHGGENESSEHYETVTYWYGLPAASLIKTDELAVGDERSEARHHYVSADASEPYAITSRYEWGPDTQNGTEIYPATTDHGRTVRSQSEFTLRIAADNRGVMLRRKLDYALPNQRAEVYVADPAHLQSGWNNAGIWYLAGSSTTVFSFGGMHPGDPWGPDYELGPTDHLVQTSNRRFRDDEFLLPRRLTQGRSVIRVRIRFTPVTIPLFPGRALPPLGWSELRYSAYSYRLPDFRLPSRSGATP
jgi:hypothetical protein